MVIEALQHLAYLKSFSSDSFKPCESFIKAVFLLIQNQPNLSDHLKVVIINSLKVFILFDKSNLLKVFITSSEMFYQSLWKFLSKRFCFLIQNQPNLSK